MLGSASLGNRSVTTERGPPLVGPGIHSRTPSVTDTCRVREHKGGKTQKGRQKAARSSALVPAAHPRCRRLARRTRLRPLPLAARAPLKQRPLAAPRRALPARPLADGAGALRRWGCERCGCPAAGRGGGRAAPAAGTPAPPRPACRLPQGAAPARSGGRAERGRRGGLLFLRGRRRERHLPAREAGNKGSAPAAAAPAAPARDGVPRPGGSRRLRPQEERPVPQRRGGEAELDHGLQVNLGPCPPAAPPLRASRPSRRRRPLPPPPPLPPPREASGPPSEGRPREDGRRRRGTSVLTQRLQRRSPGPGAAGARRGRTCCVGPSRAVPCRASGGGLAGPSGEVRAVRPAVRRRLRSGLRALRMGAGIPASGRAAVARRGFLVPESRSGSAEERGRPQRCATEAVPFSGGGYP